MLFHDPSDVVEGLRSLHGLTTARSFAFLTRDALTAARCYLSVVFVSLSLMIGDAEHFFIQLLAICMSSSEKC